MSVYAFPTRNERAWLDFVAEFRAEYAGTPDADATIDECLPKVRAHWDAIWSPTSLNVGASVPEPLTVEQRRAIGDALDRAAATIQDIATRERHYAFAALAIAEFKVAYCCRNGPQPGWSGASPERP